MPDYFKAFKLYNNLMVRMKLFDTPGQERFRIICESYYKSSDSIILVYDITQKSSFEECKKYYRNRIKEICKSDIKVILIGNKIDFEDHREVSTEEGYNFALENGYIFMETSCKINENVYEAFEHIIYETPLRKDKNEEKKRNNILL